MRNFPELDPHTWLEPDTELTIWSYWLPACRILGPGILEFFLACLIQVWFAHILNPVRILADTINHKWRTLWYSLLLRLFRIAFLGRAFWHGMWLQLECWLASWEQLQRDTSWSMALGTRSGQLRWGVCFGIWSFTAVVQQSALASNFLYTWY